MQSNYPNSLKSAAIAKILIPALWNNGGCALQPLIGLFEIVIQSLRFKQSQN